MRRTRFDGWPCPIARATDLIGDWWTPLVLREAFAGKRRFEDFQRGLDVPRAILARRLTRLVDEGLMVKKAYAVDEHTGKRLDVRRLRVARERRAKKEQEA